MDLGLAGANVVIAGGTKGMGLAAAECFADDGANVAVLARRQGPLDEALASLRTLGSPDPLAIPTDLAQRRVDRSRVRDDRRALGRRRQLPRERGRARESRATVEQVTDEAWFEAIEIGALSAVRCVRPALPMLRAAEWGRIVNVSAHSTKRQTAGLDRVHRGEGGDDEHQQEPVAPPRARRDPGEHGLARHVPLGGSAHLHRVAAAERNVDSTNLYDAMRAISEDFGHPAQMPRAGDPKEIGAVIAFVGSRRNSYMTGANINVDGGSDFT